MTSARANMAMAGTQAMARRKAFASLAEQAAARAQSGAAGAPFKSQASLRSLLHPHPLPRL
jgi:hypothetical protein